MALFNHDSSPQHSLPSVFSHKHLETVYHERIMGQVSLIEQNDSRIHDGNFHSHLSTEVFAEDSRQLENHLQGLHDQLRQLDQSLRNDLAHAKQVAKGTMQEAYKQPDADKQAEIVQRQHGDNVLKIVTENRKLHAEVQRQIQALERAGRCARRL